MATETITLEIERAFQLLHEEICTSLFAFLFPWSCFFNNIHADCANLITVTTSELKFNQKIVNKF